MADSMDKCVLKYDHFENIHRLPSTVLTIDGAPNFRKVPGFMVFGTGGSPNTAAPSCFISLPSTLNLRGQEAGSQNIVDCLGTLCIRSQ